MLNFAMPRFSCSKLSSLCARMKLWSPLSKPDSKSERVISLSGKDFFLVWLGKARLGYLRLVKVKVKLNWVGLGKVRLG